MWCSYCGLNGGSHGAFCPNIGEMLATKREPKNLLAVTKRTIDELRERQLHQQEQAAYEQCVKIYGMARTKTAQEMWKQGGIKKIEEMHAFLEAGLTKQAQPNLTGYPLPTNEPKPRSNNCRICMRQTWTKDARCVRCVRQSRMYDDDMFAMRDAWENVLLYRENTGETGPGLAARYPDATQAVPLREENKIVCDDGRWDE